MEDRTFIFVRTIFSIPVLILMILFLYSSTDKQQCLTRIDIDKEMDFHFVVSEKKKGDKSLTLYGQDLLTGGDECKAAEKN
jgi:hypothetical protein